ncbi:hypothetical protein VPH35_103742 [Triticum aestivum]
MSLSSSSTHEALDPFSPSPPPLPFPHRSPSPCIALPRSTPHLAVHTRSPSTPPSLLLCLALSPTTLHTARHTPPPPSPRHRANPIVEPSSPHTRRAPLAAAGHHGRLLSPSPVTLLTPATSSDPSRSPVG